MGLATMIQPQDSLPSFFAPCPEHRRLRGIVHWRSATTLINSKSHSWCARGFECEIICLESRFRPALVRDPQGICTHVAWMGQKGARSPEPVLPLPALELLSWPAPPSKI